MSMVGRGPRPQPTIADLRSAYAAGATTPADVVGRTMADIEARGDDGTWITLLDAARIAERLGELRAADPDRLPLYGVPFGVKDSIDVAGLPTTLACPEYAYQAVATAPAVQRLLDAGAVLIGKTNLDQFATGLNGTRTPYTIPRSVYGRSLISGGSSSGSALAVALGQVPFAVATDTAGSGRVPAALNGIVGFKPSRGLVSTVGLVPACRSLDCMSLMATDVGDVATVLDAVVGLDARDAWSRPRGPRAAADTEVRVGLPDLTALEFFGDTEARAEHAAARDRLAGVAGLHAVDTDVAPFLAAGELLYQGPWVVERVVEFGRFVAEHPKAVLPVVASILAGAARYSAADVFRAQYRLAELRAEAARAFEHMDVLALPTVGTTFTVDEVLADPVDTNTALGHYTHFGNLLDLCAVSLPAGTTPEGRPVAVMLLAPAQRDDLLLLAAAGAAPALAAAGVLTA